MTRTTVAALALLALAAGPVHAQTSTRRFYDSTGHDAGRSDISGGTTTFRDEHGRETSRAIRDGSRTLYLDNHGRRIGTEDAR